MIDIKDFQKIDLRTAEIMSCKRVPDTKNLLEIGVDVGPLGKRKLVAGLAKKYKPEEMEGKKIIIVANLEPKKIRGVESQGMLLATEDMILLTTEEDSKNGSKIK